MGEKKQSSPSASDFQNSVLKKHITRLISKGRASDLSKGIQIFCHISRGPTSCLKLNFINSLNLFQILLFKPSCINPIYLNGFNMDINHWPWDIFMIIWKRKGRSCSPTLLFETQIFRVYYVHDYMLNIILNYIYYEMGELAVHWWCRLPYTFSKQSDTTLMLFAGLIW